MHIIFWYECLKGNEYLKERKTGIILNWILFPVELTTSSLNSDCTAPNVRVISEQLTGKNFKGSGRGLT
jgi:hypothetical protein